MTAERTKIIVASRPGDDYHASVEGHPEIWGRGDSPVAAIGDLVMSHPEVVGIDVEVTP